MAYVTTNPPAAIVGAKTATIWRYSSTDAHTVVAGAGYFTNGADLGMKAGDIMFVVDTDSATATMHSVASATTVNAATLA